jgi:hypothetical protein
MARPFILATALSLVASVGLAASQTAPTPVDRLALRGAIACTWLLSDSPKQYEIFEFLRQVLTLKGQVRQGHVFSDAEKEELIKEFEKKSHELKLTSFEEGMLESCIQREYERMESLVSPP